MNVLLVYPECPDTFWSFKHALKFIAKKALHPPLGLLTVAAMLPEAWKKRLVDMNVESLTDEAVEWADYVFIGAVVIQKKSAKRVLRRCKRTGVAIVAGGPLFTVSYDTFPEVDHFILNEAEITLPKFLKDLASGNLKRMYASDEFPSLKKTPVPLWDLISLNRYASMAIQYSRGCPFNCDFCDITTLFGRKVRTKSKYQILAELDCLYAEGWRGNIFFVDDNFIGNKFKLKNEILPAINNWMKKRKNPFVFSTEVSIDISDDETLMDMMAETGFDSVFVGIETPNKESLAECNKMQNRNRDLVACVKKIQKHGFQVQGGFIVGFDSDSSSIFERQIDFIQKSRIITAMVGLLNAPRGSRLYKRIVREGRLLADVSGDNTDLSINFIPKMGQEKLIAGYKTILRGVYSPKPYYERIRRFLRDYKPVKKQVVRLNIQYIGLHARYLRAFFLSLFTLGIKDRERIYYWKLLFWSLCKRPRLLPLAITFAIYGFHFRKVFENHLIEAPA